MEPFAFVVSGIPRTPKAQSKEGWKEEVRLAAKANWPPDRPPLVDESRVTIVYFYSQSTTIDVDNIGKLILDAMKGVVFEDDGTISQVILRKTDRAADFVIEGPPAILAEALEKYRDFDYIDVKGPPNHRELPE